MIGHNDCVQPKNMDLGFECGLPLNIFKRILHYVSPNDYEAVASVSQCWKYACFEHVSDQISPKAGQLITVDLKKVELSFALMEKSMHFEDLVILVEKQKKLLKLEMVTKANPADCPLAGFSKITNFMLNHAALIIEFINFGAKEKALEVFEKIEAVALKSCDFRMYDIILLGLFDAFKDEALIHLMRLKSSQHFAIAKYLSWGETEKGTKVFEALGEETKKEILDIMPSMKAIANGDYTDLLSLEKRTSESFMATFLKEVISRLIKEGKYSQIEDKVSSMMHIKDDVKSMFVYDLIKGHRFDEAQAMIYFLGIGQQLKYSFILDVTLLFCEKKMFVEADQMLEYAEICDRDSLGKNIEWYKAVVESSDFEKNIEQTDYSFIRIEAFHSIIRKMMVSGERKKAIKIALKIPNVLDRYEALKLIRHL